MKTVFLLAMALAGRHSELQALVFDPKYIQFKPKGLGVTLYFTPKFMRKNQNLHVIKSVTHGISQLSLLERQFSARNCQVRALRYYHRYITKHPKLKKGRRRLFVPIKDNNAERSSVQPLSPD